MTVKLQQGRWFTPEEEETGAQVVVLGSRVAADLAPDGDLSKVRRWQGLPVVGILAEWDLMVAQGLSPSRVYVPIGSDIQPPGVWMGTNPPLPPGQLLVSVPPGQDLGGAAARLYAALDERHPEGAPQMLLPANATRDLLEQRNGIYATLGVLAGSCFIIGSLGLISLNFISVLSRTPEIGVRRALGATRREILRQFLGEILRLSLAMALLGVAVGFAMASLLQQRWGWPLALHLDKVLLAVGLAVLSGLATGLLPARWASRLDPSRAVRVE